MAIETEVEVDGGAVVANWETCAPRAVILIMAQQELQAKGAGKALPQSHSVQWFEETGIPERSVEAKEWTGWRQEGQQVQERRQKEKGWSWRWH